MGVRLTKLVRRLLCLPGYQASNATGEDNLSFAALRNCQRTYCYRHNTDTNLIFEMFAAGRHTSDALLRSKTRQDLCYHRFSSTSRIDYMNLDVYCVKGLINRETLMELSWILLPRWEAFPVRDVTTQRQQRKNFRTRVKPVSLARHPIEHMYRLDSSQRYMCANGCDTKDALTLMDWH